MQALIRWIAISIKRLSLAGLLLAYALIRADALTEEQIKAAYLYNFAKFAEWPQQKTITDDHLKICVLGTGSVNPAIEALKDRQLGSQLLQVTYFKFIEESLKSCQLLFIAESEKNRFLVALKFLANSPVLTVSDIEDFAEKGGSVGLLLREQKIVFEVNLENLRLSGVTLPGQLLNIAYHVYGK